VGRLFNGARKMIVARERTRLIARREALSVWPKAPTWLLRATLFRWFEESPATEWPHLQRVQEHHTDDLLRAQADALLWDTSAVADLRTRDCIMRNQHVALVHTCSTGVFVLSNADSHYTPDAR